MFSVCRLHGLGHVHELASRYQWCCCCARLCFRFVALSFTCTYVCTRTCINGVPMGVDTRREARPGRGHGTWVGIGMQERVASRARVLAAPLRQQRTVHGVRWRDYLPNPRRRKARKPRRQMSRVVFVSASHKEGRSPTHTPASIRLGAGPRVDNDTGS